MSGRHARKTRTGDEEEAAPAPLPGKAGGRPGGRSLAAAAAEKAPGASGRTGDPADGRAGDDEARVHFPKPNQSWLCDLQNTVP